jgi:hypothetical protein
MSLTSMVFDNMKRDLATLNSKILFVTQLYEKVKENSSFTKKEVEDLYCMLKEYQTEYQRKELLYKSKYGLYEDQIKKIQESLFHRQEILNAITNDNSDESFDFSDILSIFATEHRSLEKQLKKSCALLE